MWLSKIMEHTTKHIDHIDVKSEAVRAGSVGGMVGVTQVAEINHWGLSDLLIILTILYTLLQIGLLIIKYKDYFKRGRTNDTKGSLD